MNEPGINGITSGLIPVDPHRLDILIRLLTRTTLVLDHERPKLPGPTAAAVYTIRAVIPIMRSETSRCLDET